MNDFQFTNDTYWQITFSSLHQNPPEEDSIIMSWSSNIPPELSMKEAIIAQRPELERFKTHIRVHRYQQVDPRLVYGNYEG